jgi:Xaa-Pro aminopeptidase
MAGSLAGVVLFAAIGGAPIEDLVLVTEDGCETLTRFPYDIAPST